MRPNDRVSVVGLGNLGQALAVCLAWRGFHVVGVDVMTAVVASLEGACSTIVEPTVQEMLNESIDRFSATTDPARAVNETDVTMILVATPSEDDGSFSLTYVEAVLSGLGQALAASSKPSHLFVIGSTLTPGSTTRLIAVLEESSGRRLNEGFHVCYCPELVALGTAAHDFINPDVVIIGESSPAAGAWADRIYDKLCMNSPEHLHMTMAEAEMAKLALNCYLAMKISFGNAVSRLCERVPGADSRAVTAVLQRDRRIGKGYLDGGLPYGGPCFPRDMLAYLEVANRVGDPASLIHAAETVNGDQLEHVTSLILQQVEALSADRVAILGIAFKENSSLLLGSAGVAIAEELLSRGIEVTVFDPVATTAAQNQFGERLAVAGSLEAAVNDARVVVVTTRDAQFRPLSGSMLPPGPTAVIDCWRVVDPGQLRKETNHILLGKSAEPAYTAAN